MKKVYLKYSGIIDLLLFIVFCVSSFAFLIWLFFVDGFPNSIIWQPK